MARKIGLHSLPPPTRKHDHSTQSYQPVKGDVFLCLTYLAIADVPTLMADVRPPLRGTCLSLVPLPAQLIVTYFKACSLDMATMIIDWNGHMHLGGIGRASLFGVNLRVSVCTL